MKLRAKTGSVPGNFSKSQLVEGDDKESRVPLLWPDPNNMSADHDDENVTSVVTSGALTPLQMAPQQHHLNDRADTNTL